MSGVVRTAGLPSTSFSAARSPAVSEQRPDGWPYFPSTEKASRTFPGMKPRVLYPELT